jgi:hypothetical protein
VKCNTEEDLTGNRAGESFTITLQGITNPDVEITNAKLKGGIELLMGRIDGG